MEPLPSLASSKLATRLERAIGGSTVSDQNQRRFLGPAAGLIDATVLPTAAVYGVIRLVLVDPGAEAGPVHGEGQ
jgi:hypothetical protein